MDISAVVAWLGIYLLIWYAVYELLQAGRKR